MMVATVAVQTNGLGASFQASRYSSIASCKSGTLVKVPRRPAFWATCAFGAPVPERWVVVSTQPAPQRVPAGEGRAPWAFEPTPRISSYITAVVAGPYAAVWDSFQGRDAVIPMGIFVRQSLAEYVDNDNLFDVTKKGIAFLEAEFDMPFPFAKYDQIFVPEYNLGAMELSLIHISEPTRPY